MNVGSLFSGIGGFDLGLERAGMEVRWQVENDPYCLKVLAKHWPDVKRYGDIKEIDWNEVEPVDLICGGFPCQPVSLAGKRLAQADERWLWPEVARCVRALRPGLVFLENVPGLLSAGMSDVLGDLAALGYDAEWERIPAAAVGAPHLRHRIWIVAYPAGPGVTTDAGVFGDDHERGSGRAGGEAIPPGAQAPHAADPQPGGPLLADPSSTGHESQPGGVASTRDESGPFRFGQPISSGQTVAHPQIFAQQPGLCPDESGGERGRRSGDGGSTGDVSDTDSEGLAIGNGCATEARPCAAFDQCSWWATEPDVGRVANGIPARVDRLRGLGNAVVPQVAEWIGRRIVEVADG